MEPPGKTYQGPSDKAGQQAGPAIPESPTKSDAARGESAPPPTKPRIPAPAGPSPLRPGNDAQLYQGG